jgi:hypothetical protein
MTSEIEDPDNDSGVHPVNGEIEVTASDTPIQARLKKTYIDKYNTLMVSGMDREAVNRHIADIEDQIKVLQTMQQASMDVSEEWARGETAEEREIIRKKDKAYRALARPAMNADGSIKTTHAKVAKPVVIGDSGSQAFENLVAKLMLGGLTRENAEKLLKSGGK